MNQIWEFLITIKLLIFIYCYSYLWLMDMLGMIQNSNKRLELSVQDLTMLCSWNKCLWEIQKDVCKMLLKMEDQISQSLMPESLMLTCKLKVLLQGLLLISVSQINKQSFLGHNMQEKWKKEYSQLCIT